MTKDSPDIEPAKILWTGGWDSTFQLLQLLIVQKRRVIPYYLIDEDRRSTGVELLSIKNIKSLLLKRFAHIRELLGPTQYYSVSDISHHSEITESYNAILKKCFIGSQYEWLARFCEERSISNLQLCIHNDDKAHAAIANMVAVVSNNSEKVLQIDKQYSSTNEYTLFRYFTFPILGLTKLEMASIARTQGTDDIMGVTWFCHNPRNAQPCGTCNPCLYTIEEGLGWRIPLSRRFQSRISRLLFQPLKKLVKIALSKVQR